MWVLFLIIVLTGAPQPLSMSQLSAVQAGAGYLSSQQKTGSMSFPGEDVSGGNQSIPTSVLAVPTAPTLTDVGAIDPTSTLLSNNINPTTNQSPNNTTQNPPVFNPQYQIQATAPPVTGCSNAPDPSAYTLYQLQDGTFTYILNPPPAPNPSIVSPSGTALSQIGIDPSSLLGQMPPGVEASSLGPMSVTDIFHLAELAKHMDKKSRKMAELGRATAKMVFPEAEDDRMLDLHPARFLPLSMVEPSRWWHLVPVKLSSVSTGIQLRHLGLEYQVSPRAVELCHDRSKLMEIKHFLRSNLGVLNRPPTNRATYSAETGTLETTAELTWKEATRMEGIMEALMSYISIYASLFPFDYGPMNILRSLISWQFFAFRGEDQIRSAREVINGIMARNSQLAEESLPPMSVKDSDEFISRVLRSIGGGRCSFPDTPPIGLYSLQRNLPPAPSNTTNQRRLGQPSPTEGEGGFPTNQRQGRLPKGARGGAAYIGNLELCGQYNSAIGCPRNPTGRTCSTGEGKKILHHRCSQKSSRGTICGQSHSRSQHT